MSELRDKQGKFRKGHVPWHKNTKGLSSTYWKSKHHTKKTKDKIRQKNKGKHNSPATEFKKDQKPWNKGKTNIYSKEIIDSIARKLKGRKLSRTCIKKLSVISTERWKKLEYRNKNRKAAMLSKNLKINKKEEELNKLLYKLVPGEYKFVGDGEVVLGGFCPDFINVNGQKKIIELFGDFWHNIHLRPETDKRRLETYTKYGYKLLIIWEHELKNIRKLKKKLKGFFND